jgi:hypothetical protein
MNFNNLTYNKTPDGFGVFGLLYKSEYIGALMTSTYAESVVAACRAHQAAKDDEEARAELASMMVLGPQYGAAFIVQACQEHKKLTEDRATLIAALLEIRRAASNQSPSDRLSGMSTSAIEDMVHVTLLAIGEKK